MGSRSQIERIVMFDLDRPWWRATTLPRAHELRQQTDTARIARRNRESRRIENDSIWREESN